MFSGLVAALGEVRALRRRGRGAVVEVRCALSGEPLAAGESVAVQGVCLTVVAPDGEGFSADLSPETLSRTTLGTPATRRKGQPRALPSPRRPHRRPHRARSRRRNDLGRRGPCRATDSRPSVSPFRVRSPARWQRKARSRWTAFRSRSPRSARAGSTWRSSRRRSPHTTLGKLRPGDKVNLETDVLAKYVRRALGGQRPDLESLLSGLCR